MRPDDTIPDAPVYTATMAEMENLEELLATANELAMQYGAVRIDPPAEWKQPPLRMAPKSRFFVRMQTLPAAPFVDPQLVNHPDPPKNHPRKRTRRKPINLCDQDSDEPVLLTKQSKTPSRDRAARAARAASRSHRHQHSNPETTPPNPSLPLPQNPAVAPATPPPPQLQPYRPKPVAKEEHPLKPFATGQTFARPIFVRAPPSQIQPNSASKGKNEAAREAALRLAEAFTGFATAGPAPNAIAIPPCPFSQQTAREHMAKRTGEDTSRFPLINALPLPQPMPTSPTDSCLQSNIPEAHTVSASEEAESIIPCGEPLQSRGDENSNRNADVKGATPQPMPTPPTDSFLQSNVPEAHTVSSREEVESIIPCGEPLQSRGDENSNRNADVKGAKPQPMPTPPTDSFLQSNIPEAHNVSAREEAESIIPCGEPLQSRGDENSNRNADVKEAKPLQDNGVQHFDISVRAAERIAKDEAFASAAVHTSTEITNCSGELLTTKNSEADTRAIHEKWSPQVVPTSNLADPGRKTDMFQTVTNGSEHTDYRTADTLKPFSSKLDAAPGHESPQGADKSLQDIIRAAPFLSFPTNLPAPNAIVKPANIDRNLAENESQGLPHPTTAVRDPARELERCNAASSQQKTLVRPALRSVLPPLYGRVNTEQPNASRNANCIRPVTISSPPTPNALRIQEGQLIQHHEMISTCARPDHSPFPSSLRKPNELSFADNNAHTRRECEMVSALVRAPPGQPQNTAQVPTTKAESLLSAPAECIEKNNPDEKRSTVMKPEGIMLSTHEGSYGNASREPGEKFCGSHYAPATHLILDSERLAHQSKQTLSNACTAIPLLNVKKAQAVPQSTFPFSVERSEDRKYSTSDSPCKAEPCFTEQSRILVSGPAPKTSQEKSAWNRAYCGTAGLPSVQREVTNDIGREMVEEILAVVTRRADIASTEAPQAKVDQEETTNHPIHAGLPPPAETSTVEVPCPIPIPETSQKEQLNSDKRTNDAMLDRPLMLLQDEVISLVPRLEQPISLPQQQPSKPAQLGENAVKTKDVMIVAETRVTAGRECQSRKDSASVPIINVDAEDAPNIQSKDNSSYPKPQAKRTPKRKMESRNMHFDQDDVGRLTKAIVFPDSGIPVSLAAYKKKANGQFEETKRALNCSEEGGASESNSDHLMPKTDMHDVDALEVEFWKAMTAGIHGKPITVAYGVDVEAEGAFDSAEMSYVEWHGADPTGTKTNKRRKGRPRKPKAPKTERRPRSTENIANKSANHAVGSFADDPHHDADDEMEQDDEGMRSTMYRTDKSTSPRSHVGTLNREGILRHLPRMPGINHSMYYIGQLFTRFCWHTEDAFLNSVSYLHPGSAKKVWYAVPPKYAPAFEEYAASTIFSPSLLEDENSGQILLMNKTTMFDPRRVRRKGVAVYRVVHKPGSFVLTAARAYHAGFNCGFNIAEAVNFANPTWFSVGREASSFARKTYKPLCVPWEYLLFHEAKAMHDIDHGSSKRITSANRLVNNAKVVAKELKAIIMDGEAKIRKYAEARNCRVSMLHEIDGLTKHNQVGPQFGSGAGMVCTLCTHTCHFYAEMCGSCDDSFEARCVDHFGEGHKMCLHDKHKTVIVRRHDPVLLLDILGCLERMAGIEVDATEQARRYLGYLRTWQTPLRPSGLRLRLDLRAAVSRLPPKVSKDKKTIRDKVVRDKTDRDKRRKIRKPRGRGMFPRVEGKNKRAMFPQAEFLGDVEVIAPPSVRHERRNEVEYVLDGVVNSTVDLTNKIPLLG